MNLDELPKRTGSGMGQFRHRIPARVRAGRGDCTGIGRQFSEATMARPICGSFVLFGGVKDGEQRYCSKKCYEADDISRVAKQVPVALVEKFAMALHEGPCPKCNGSGPVDIHESHSVYSAVVYTKYQTKQHLLCKKCALKQQTVDLVGSLIAGWWGIPLGPIVTPGIVIMDVVSMSRNPGLSGPTNALKQRARMLLAARHLANDARP